MNRSRVLLFGIVSTLLLVKGDAPCSAGAPERVGVPAFAFDITIERAPSSHEAVLCQAKLTDSETGEVLFAPNLTLRLGESGEASSAGTVRGAPYRYELTVMGAAGNARFELRVSKDGRRVLTTAGTVRI